MGVNQSATLGFEVSLGHGADTDVQMIGKRTLRWQPRASLNCPQAQVAFEGRYDACIDRPRSGIELRQPYAFGHSHVSTCTIGQYNSLPRTLHRLIVSRNPDNVTEAKHACMSR